MGEELLEPNAEPSAASEWTAKPIRYKLLVALNMRPFGTEGLSSKDW